MSLGDGYAGYMGERTGGDRFVFLVIKDRVASMAGVWTGCGKLLECL